MDISKENSDSGTLSDQDMDLKVNSSIVPSPIVAFALERIGNPASRRNQMARSAIPRAPETGSRDTFSRSDSLTDDFTLK